MRIWEGPLFFGASAGFQEMMKSVPDVKIVIVRLEQVSYVDQSGLYAMEEVLLEMQRKGIRVVFTGLHGQIKSMFEKIDIVPDLIPEEDCFETFNDCINWLNDYLK